MICPRRSSEPYKELVDAVGDTAIAHLIHDRNNGYDLDFDPAGNKSKLFERILSYTENDRRSALQIKAKMYLSDYTDIKGVWYDPYVEEPPFSFYTTLYRGEGTKQDAALPDWAKANVGQWYTTSRSKAESFAKDRNGKVYAIAIPTDLLSQYRAPEGNPLDEYLIPEAAQINYGKQELDENTRKLAGFADKLASRFGYSWDFAHPGELRDRDKASIRMTGEIPVIVIRREGAVLEDVIHEFGHIFIEHIKRDNKPLYNNLLKEFEKLPDDYKKSLRKFIVEAYPGFSDTALTAETLTHLLESYAADTIDKETGLYKALTDVWDYIKQLISEVFGVEISKLGRTLTFEQLADLMMNPEVPLNLGDPFGSGEFFESYSGDYAFDIPYGPKKAKVKVPEAPKEYTAAEVKDKILAIGKDIESLDKDHPDYSKGRYRYKKDESYEYLEGVTSRIARFWGGIPDDVSSIYSEVGNTIHGNIDDIQKGVSAELAKKYGDVVLTPRAKKEIAAIFKNLKGKFTALTEVQIADKEQGLASKVDLILIDETGRIMLFDFKTKIRRVSIDKDGVVTEHDSSFVYWNKAYNPGDHTDKEKAHLQLSMYAHMIEKLTGLPVGSINVVKLDAKMKGTWSQEGKGKKKKFTPGNTIDSVEVYSEDEELMYESFYNKHGEVQFQNATRRIYYGEDANLHSKTMENQTKRAKDEAEITFSQLTEGESEGGKLLDELRKDIATRLDFARKRTSQKNRRRLENLAEQLQEEDSVTDSLYNIIGNAKDEIDEVIKEINKYIKEDKAFTPGVLYKWKDAVQGFQSLTKIQNLLFTNPELIPNRNYIKMLDESIKHINWLENLYKKEGRHLIAKWLTPYYNGIRVKMADSLKEEYRRMRYREVKRGKKSLDQFEQEYGSIDEWTNKRLAAGNTRIENETKNLLFAELETASRDIGEMTRWIDNMLDQSDPVSSALVNAFVQADEKSRLEAIDKKYEMSDILEELQRHHFKGINQSEEAYYSFMLEHDENGNLTQYILRPYRSSFWQDLEKEREEYSTATKDRPPMTKAEISKALKDFKKKSREFMEEEFLEELYIYIDKLFTEKTISQKEVELILGFLMDSGYYNLDELEDVEGLEPGTADLIASWKGKNMSLFYAYDEKYINPEWDKFLNLVGIDNKQSLYRQMGDLKKSTNPYAKFYMQIEEISKQANQMLPYGYRIYDRLPGVAKLMSERLKGGQTPMSIAKETMSADVFVRPEDVERGNQEYTNEYGRVKYYIPINFTSKIEPQNQSYDIVGIMFKFWESANDYRNKRNILPELEMTRFFINQRKAYKRNVFKDVMKKSTGVDDNDVNAVKKDKTVLAEMFNDWFDMALYGKRSKSETTLIQLSDKKSLDVMKMVDLMNRYTSLNLLGLNFVQGFANLAIGEVMQGIETIAHEYVTPTSYTKANLKYTKFLPEVLADVSRDVPKSLGGMIYQEFDVLDEDPTDTTFSKNSKLGKAYYKTSVYFMQRAGEHLLQNKFLLAMLIEKKAYDINGKLLGNMLDQYEIVDGRLKLKSEVNLEKSEWTTKDQLAFKSKVRGILSRMHGEYGDLGRVALQRIALGRMAYMFRKFVVPGMRRRWASKQYMERLGQYTEGNYVTTFNFLRNYYKELATFQFAVMGENWAALSDHEKANIRRTVTEAAFITAALILASAFYNMSADDDDEWLYGFLAYQAYRLKTELLFFSNPSEAWSILRSPMASMAIMQNILDLSGELLHPGDRYERGPWKGQLKIKKTMLDFVPIYKQFYKARDIEQQISWFRN